MSPSQSSSKIVVEVCRECRLKPGDWHDKDCSIGSMGPGRVSDSPRIYLERTVYVNAEQAARERAEASIKRVWPELAADVVVAIVVEALGDGH